MLKKPIYLDYNATTPCDPAVVEAMMPCFTGIFGNAASRDHSFGWEASEMVEHAREQLGRLIGARPKDMIFTSGATEGVNLALKGLALSGNPERKHIITSETEHEAVLDTCTYLEEKGYRISRLGVDAFGHIRLDELRAETGPDTLAIVLMYANNETGVIHPVKKIGETARKNGAVFICDATQAVGKVPVNVLEENIDMLVFSSHKMYGPKGIGALYAGRDVKPRIVPQLHGGKHERGYRSGTLNVPGIVGFGKAAAISRKRMETEAVRLSALRDRVEEVLLGISGTKINGDRENRLPHVTNISFDGIEGSRFILALAKDMAVSRGSACSGNVHAPSHVLRAMGVEDDRARNSLRISLGRFTTEKETGLAAEVIRKTAEEHRIKNSVAPVTGQ